MAKRKQPNANEIMAWLDVAQSNVVAAADSIEDADSSGPMTADEFRAAQRDLLLLARDATALAAKLFGTIRMAESKEALTKAKS